jgi:hypothetical protein
MPAMITSDLSFQFLRNVEHAPLLHGDAWPATVCSNNRNRRECSQKHERVATTVWTAVQITQAEPL